MIIIGVFSGLTDVLVEDSVESHRLLLRIRS